MDIVFINRNIIKNDAYIIRRKMDFIEKLKADFPETKTGSVESYCYILPSTVDPANKSYQITFVEETIRRRIAKGRKFILVFNGFFDIGAVHTVSVNFLERIMLSPCIEDIYLNDLSSSPYSSYHDRVISALYEQRGGGVRISRKRTFPNPFKEYIITLHQKGVSISALSKKLGLNQSTLQSFINSAGLSERHSWGVPPSEEQITKAKSYLFMSDAEYNKLATIHIDQFDD